MDMNKFRTRWMFIKMSIFHKLGMQTSIQHLFLDGEIEKKYPISKLKHIVKNDPIPHNKRMAAIRLYDVGEKDFAIAFLIEQMNLYTKPDTPDNIKSETCVHSAIALGRINDQRALPHLYNALGELAFFGASYALSLMNGHDIAVELVKIASLENRKGLHAVIALGFMKNDGALPFLIKIVERRQELTEKYKTDSSTNLLTHFACNMLGLYDNDVAKKLFLSILTKDSMAFLISDYVRVKKFPRSYTVGNEVGWYITKKYGWDKYVNSDGLQFAFLFSHLSGWGTYFKTPCPFKSTEEADALREEIKNKIWSGLVK